MRKIIAVIVVVILGLFFIGFFPKPYIDAPQNVIVRNGDTLWDIVDRAMDRTKDDRPIELVIYNTRIANGIDAKKVGNLHAGEQIVIPCRTRETK